MRDYFGERLGAEWAMFSEFSFPEFGRAKRDARIHQAAAVFLGIHYKRGNLQGHDAPCPYRLTSITPH
jgi:hypothetical protein